MAPTISRPEESWSNDEPLSLRTRLGLKVLLLMFKVISPYRFEKDLARIEAEINETGKKL